MKLIYHKGNNFGDALNPLIFKTLLPGFFDEDDSKYFLGIGSILGLFKPEGSKEITVFSSGFADGDVSTYGSKPEISDNYNVICVRGPLTAKALNLNPNLAISDGAILLPFVKDIPIQEKTHKISYMPHVGTFDVYDGYKQLLNSIGIHLIDPRQSVDSVILEMQQTSLLLTEAMHGAIVADTLRIPWVPVKMIKTINEFKWRDYLASVETEYSPNYINTLYSLSFLKKIFQAKFTKFNLNFLSSTFANIYYFYQKIIIERIVKKKFRHLINCNDSLCDEGVLKKRQNELLSLISKLQKKSSN